MRSASDLEIELRNVAGADLKMTSVPGVYRIGEPITPGGSRRLSDVKRKILQTLAGTFPHCALSIDANDAELLASINRALPTTMKRDGLLWMILPASELPLLAPTLDRGGWGVFFAGSTTLSSGGPASLTFDDEEALALTRRVGANASVISWYDDVDWLICVP